MKLPENKVLKLLILIIIGVGLNVAGSFLVNKAGIPLYLDNVGTLLISILGGLMPGVIVGFLSNIVSSIGYEANLYYGVLTVLIALVSSFFAQKGFFKKAWGVVVVILTLALIGGGGGSIITWLLYGFSFGEGTSAPIYQYLYGTGLFHPPVAQFLADFSVDIVDKTIVVLIALLIIRLLPKKTKLSCYLYGWRQAPLSSKKIESVNKVRIRNSLRTKLSVLLSLAVLIIAIAVTTISYVLFMGSCVDQQTRLADGVVNVVASNIRPDKVDEYLTLGEAAPEYLEIEQRLGDIATSSPDITYVYAYRIQEDGCHVVFDPDMPDTPGEDPGTVIPFDEAFLPYLDKLLAGEEIEPIISNETYGWLLSVYMPLKDENGVCQCYCAVDISMDQLMASGRVFLTKVIVVFAGFFILILALIVWLAEYNVILPINSMAGAAGKFAYDSEKARGNTTDRIKELDIRTGDEIENLYHSMVTTTEETVQYINEAQQQSEAVAKIQNGLILVLADLVESRDKCTGDHVRNTAAYTQIIMEQLKKDGAYSDQLTDDFISDVVNSAPLHDVGKIHVPDALLNKPGKLTDEEFALMKEHTTAGSEILENTIDMVSENESGYLQEAKNLAEFHHEKWNGTGYPRGLAGEEIPLSARIMAVADVFDALISKRSYKEGMPFDKAMNIIREGSGTHFDPVVAQAFLEAEDEVREVAEHRKRESQ